MKLASLKAGRDGCLVVASDDLARAVSAAHVARSLRDALDRWDRVRPQLQVLADELAAGRAGDAFALAPERLAAPMPRAPQWLDGSAYVNHVELVRKARGAEMPASFWTDPLMYQGGSDRLLGPREDIAAVSEDWGIDFEAEIAVVLGDVPMGASVAEAAAAIRLLLLVNDVSLRNLIPAELAKGFSFLHGKPPTAFAPAAVTPETLGDAWDGARLHLPVSIHLNGERFGAPEAGQDMTFDFPTLVAHAAKTRPLSAGTILGAGTVSNVDRARGSACIAEQRMLEQIAGGKPRTPFLRFGDRVRIDVLDAAGGSVFGAIEQRVVPYRRAAG
ncbi:MAG: fumarylacetoacetate hydrolase family protein [Alphaproteobacteria bacterium]|nr:fumarylacetoacetate hydrolase family protein [Alphaproteobacteria bacterium]